MLVKNRVSLGSAAFRVPVNVLFDPAVNVLRYARVNGEFPTDDVSPMKRATVPPKFVGSPFATHRTVTGTWLPALIGGVFSASVACRMPVSKLITMSHVTVIKVTEPAETVKLMAFNTPPAGALIVIGALLEVKLLPPIVPVKPELKIICMLLAFAPIEPLPLDSVTIVTVPPVPLFEIWTNPRKGPALMPLGHYSPPVKELM